VRGSRRDFISGLRDFPEEDRPFGPPETRGEERLSSLLVQEERLTKEGQWSERHAEAAVIARSADFGEIEAMNASGDIPEVELRTMRIMHLRAVWLHVKRRCVAEDWTRKIPVVAAITLETVNLYDVADYVIRPASLARCCAFVELIMDRGFAPRWFVSHWWGEPVKAFLACLEQHAWDHRQEAPGLLHTTSSRCDSMVCNSPPYWICAYANNQWALGDSVSNDPGQSSFRKAMDEAVGTVSILDHGGFVFTRIWCCYELYISLINPKEDYKWAVYTTNEHKHDTYGWRKAVGLTDGLAPCDAGGAASKQRRERHFPLQLAVQALDITLETAQASVEADRVHILNTVVGSADLSAAVPDNHPEFTLMNDTLRARFAQGSVGAACEQGSEAVHRFFAALSRGHITSLQLDLQNERNAMTPAAVRQYGAAFPITLETLDIQARGSELFCSLVAGIPGGQPVSLRSLVVKQSRIGDEGAVALSKAFSNGACPALESFCLDDNDISDVGFEALSQALSGGALAMLGTLSLNGNRISTSLESFSVAAASPGVLRKLGVLDISYNHIETESFDKLGEAISSGALPSLYHLGIYANGDANGGSREKLKDACDARYKDSGRKVVLELEDPEHRFLLGMARALA